MSDLPSMELLARWRSESDQSAAAELFQRYAERLVGLARSRLPGRMARRIDPQDVVQSACRTFFVRARDGRLEVRPDGDLWQLLAAITMNKLFGQMEHHSAGKRAVRREQEPAEEGSVCLVPDEGMARDPKADEVLAIHEELELAFAGMSPLHRKMIELRLLGHTSEEIAAETGRTDRLVRLVVAQLAERLRDRLLSYPGDTAESSKP